MKNRDDAKEVGYQHLRKKGASKTNNMTGQYKNYTEERNVSSINAAGQIRYLHTK